MPPQWSPPEAPWPPRPSHAELWQENLEPAQRAFARLVAAIAEGETAEVLVLDAAGEASARAALPSHGVRYHRIPFGDIWLRDTAPIFLLGEGGARASIRFAFNGWGGKYVLEHDDGVAAQIAATRSGGQAFVMPWVLEGGAVDVDGEGTVLTTRQCLLNPNRNPTMTDIERAVAEALGCDKVLWLGDGLANDHTDGHVDTIARFVRPGVVVVMEPRTADDPNRDVLHAVARDARAKVDARGRRLEVVTLPSPGAVRDATGRPM
ncbi:MAG: agmatine deiminase family protein, partial [Polyangiaceae bacterium]|nr:agmatine deiminase family protein [Polyangiaceae bacterium]